VGAFQREARVGTVVPVEGAGGRTPGERLFVAVWPTVDVVDVLGSLVRADEPGVRWVPAENWHITLRFLGQAHATEVGERLAGAVLPHATAVLGPVVARLGHEAVVVPVAGLDELARAACEATADVGRPVDARPFHAHVTVARLRHGARCGAVGRRVSARFEVQEVVLARSVTHPGGARYETLGRWPARRR
jgi:2'-5' RNA ligase